MALRPCLLFSLCFGIFLVSIGIASYLRREPSIPKGSLSVIRQAFLSVIYKLILQQRL
ncbi:hypothetical protein SBV42_00025 [Chlamydia crocodili]|uniref:Uncharacterized protein n=1 Tax=Chlamydia crocodili TaxID=2766982 RepID=A0ABX8CDT9_9CHLA|nr:hypothetical protein [Chlamydia crocodili]QVE49161.1 hypothetical protein H9Q19_00390 [Chlamydia crocodili]